MIDDLVALREHFKIIKNKGWIESMRNGTTGIGYTFEALIGKEEERFPIPDYGTIEIKTRFRNSKENINLFSAAPDGDYLFATKTMYDRFGYPDKKNPQYKVFYAKIGTIARYAGKDYRFRLHVNREKELIRIIAIDKIGNFIDTEVTWSFDLLRKKLDTKLKYLALVKADTMFNIEKQFFKYYEITFYMLKDFNTFISLIEQDIINVTFMTGVHKSGTKAGLMNNHGVRFDISEKDLEKLFIKVC